MTEKVDIFLLGSAIYNLITGVTPYENTEYEDKVIVRMIMNDEQPKLPASVTKSTDPFVQLAVDVMWRCRTYDSTKRPSARFLTRYIEEEMDQLGFDLQRQLQQL